MPPNLKRLAHEWFTKGQHDLEAAKKLYQHGGPYDAVCFHCQQAVEKYLKGYLVRQRVDLTAIRIHELVRLLEECVKHERQLARLLKPCAFLTRYYIEARCPIDEPVTYSRREAQRAIDAANQVISELQRILK